MTTEELKESLDYFDKFINMAISQNIEGVTPLEVIKHYNNVKNQLAKILVEKE
jgi:RNase H-fold protein (predicted Holliday junction resolvase)